nr:MAG TPA: hypothetical protein [Caudoviricetes sp.]
MPEIIAVSGCSSVISAGDFNKKSSFKRDFFSLFSCNSNH